MFPLRYPLSRRLAIGTLLGASAAVISSHGKGAAEPTRKVIDASAFGVVADGISNDAPALDRAVAALSDGCVLNLPAGAIALGAAGWLGISIQRLNDVRIQGNCTVLKWLAAPSQSTAGFGPTGLRLHECRNVVIAEIAIDGNGVACVGLGLDGCTWCVVREVEAYAHGAASEDSSAGQFASSRGSYNRWFACIARDATPGSKVRGFYLGNANKGLGDTDLRIDGCTASRNSATGFAIEGTRVICADCTSENNGGAGFTSSTADGSPASDHIFQGNIARANAFHGWQTDVYGANAERVVLTGNILSDNAFSGVYCHKGTAISIVGNVIAGNGRDTASAAISVTMSNRVTLSNNIIEGDAVHGVCVGVVFKANIVRDMIIANNLCRGSTSRTIWIEAADPESSLQGIVASGNIISGGSHGIYLATSAAGAALDAVTLSNNVVERTTAASYLISDHSFGQSTNMRFAGNSGDSASFSSNVRLAEDRDNSWNSFKGEATAAPARGTWQQGAIVFNSAPSPGTPIGWVCTSGGEPGTWNRFGIIDG